MYRLLRIQPIDILIVCCTLPVWHRGAANKLETQGILERKVQSGAQQTIMEVKCCFGVQFTFKRRLDRSSSWHQTHSLHNSLSSISFRINKNKQEWKRERTERIEYPFYNESKTWCHDWQKRKNIYNCVTWGTWRPYGRNCNYKLLFRKRKYVATYLTALITW